MREFRSVWAEEIQDEFNAWIVEPNQTAPKTRSSVKGPRDPVKYLPPELWTDIFMRLIENDPNTPLSFLLVSSVWAQAVLSVPKLWTIIHIKCTSEASQVASFVALSQDCPINMTLEIPLESPELREQLFRVKDRISKLTFVSCPAHSTTYSLCESTRRLARELERLPLLEVVDFSHVPVHSQITLDFYAPRVKSIRRWGTPHAFAWEDLPNLDLISSFTEIGLVSVTWEVVYGVLKALPNLERLCLTQDGGSVDALATNEEAESKIRELDDFRAVALRNLDIDITDGSESLLNPILEIAGTFLTQLSITMDGEGLKRFLSLSVGLSRLDLLQIYIPDEETTKVVPPVSLPLFPSVPTVEISGKPFGAIEASSALGCLLQCIGNITPNAYDLRVKLESARLSPSDLQVALAKFRALRNLDISIILEIQAEEYEPVSFPYLETLHANDSGILWFLEAPSLHVLHLDRRGYGPSIDDLTSPLRDNTSKSFIKDGRYEYPALKKLIWRNLDWSGMAFSLSMSNLRFIEVTGDGEESQEFGELDHILDGLLRYSLSCPQLEGLDFGNFPSWDLLFHLLKQRNMKMAGQVSPIRSLGLPGLPPSWLSAPLIQLLQHKECALPLDQELSCFRVYYPYFSSKFSGCHLCILSRQKCHLRAIPMYFPDPWSTNPESFEYKSPTKEDLETSRSINQTWKGVKGSGDDIPFGKERLNLAVLGWLDGFRERKSIWTAMWMKWQVYYKRQHSCERHQATKLTSDTILALE